MCRLLCLILVVLPIYVEGGNILMYLPIASRSYVSAWTPLVQGLASAGHQVLFVTRFKIPPLPNLTQIEVKTDAMEELENTLTQKVSESFNMTGFIEAVSKTSSVLTKTHQLSLQELRYQLDKPWHLIITSPFLNEMGIILGHYLDIPNVQFLPTNAEMLMSYGLGHPDNGAWSSNLPDSTFGRFVYILLNAVYADFVKPHFFVYPQIDLARTMLVNFTLNKQDYWKLERNADFSFYMSSILMDNVNPRLPNTAQIGFIHCRDGKPLPQRIQNFYREAEDIVLYISFGSMIKAETLGNKTLHVFNKVLKGRKAIWKISKNIVENEDILTDLWFPQQDILAQSKTKVFISPCGLMSIQEAIYHNVPLLCIPMTREQITNSDVIQRKGLGIKLDISNLSVTSLEGAIDDLINNNYYKINLKKTSDLILDRPTPILEEAIFWVEHVLRHDGADHLKSRRRYMSMIEFYHLDVLLYLFIFLSISSIIGMGWWILVLISVKKSVKYFKQYTQLDTNNNKLPKKTFKLNEANIRENIDVKRTSDIDKKGTVEMKDACDDVKGESSDTQTTHNKTSNEEIEAHEDTSSSEAHEDTSSSEAGASGSYHARVAARNESGDDAAPRFTTPSSSNLALNHQCYTNIRRALDTEAIFRTNFNLPAKPEFFGDDRIQKVPFVCPRPNFQIPGLPSTTAVTSSFNGNHCSTCLDKGKSHNINSSPRIFMYGDEHYPLYCGSNGDCMPTTRIDSGNFEQIKVVIDYQRKKGLKFVRGSLMLICLLSHLLRVGHSEYWSQLLEFVTWIKKEKLDVDVLPILVPFPYGYKTHHLISICQVYNHLLCASVGKMTSSGDLNCLLWRPFFNSVLQHGASEIYLPAPPIAVPEVGGLTECCLDFTSGMRGDWRKGVPSDIQLSFLTDLITQLKEYYPSTNLNCPIFPSTESIRDAIGNNIFLNKKIFLLGQSILDRTAPVLSVLAKDKGVEILNLTQGGDIFKKKLNYSFLSDGTSDDIIYISVVGNYILNKENHAIHNGVWHLLNPTMLSDVEANLLLVNLSQVVRRVRDNFKGHIFVQGPIARHPKRCCDEPTHHILDHSGVPVPMVDYTLAVSKFIGSAGFLHHDRITYLDYPIIMGKEVDDNSLEDGVHLSPNMNEIFASFIFNLLDPSQRPTSKTKKKDCGIEFSAILKQKGISHCDAEEDTNENDDNIDTAIQLI